MNIHRPQGDDGCIELTQDDHSSRSQDVDEKAPFTYWGHDGYIDHKVTNHPSRCQMQWHLTPIGKTMDA